MFFSATSQPITFQHPRTRNPLYIIDLQEVIGSREAGLPITHLSLTRVTKLGIRSQRGTLKSKSLRNNINSTSSEGEALVTDTC